MNTHRLQFVVACILVMLSVALASSATKTTTQSGNWSASTTWGGAPAPGPGDDVIINGDFTVTVDVTNATALSLQLGGSILGTGGGTILFSGGTQLTVSGAVTIGVTNNTPGSLTMTSGGTLVCEGFVLNRLGIWTQGTGTIVLTATNTIPSDNNINFNNLTVSGGTTTLSRNVSVSGNLLIGPGATLNGGANALTLAGNWTNNGTFNGNTGTVIFTKNGNASVTGTGANNFNLLRVDLGTAIANTLEVSATNFTAPDGFLTLTNGTFKLSGSFPFSNTFLVGPSYNIQPTSGLWINNPNATVTAQAGGVSVRGLLRLTAGTYNVGTSVDNTLDYVAGSSFIIDGGALNIAGRLSRNSPSSTTSYIQSGGTVTVATQGSTSLSFGAFDLGVAGSSCTISGGSIVVRNATSNAADYVNLAGTASITGGTLQIGDALTQDAQLIRIQSARPVGNLLVSNATSSPTKPTAQLVASGLTVVGNLQIQAGTTLDANGSNIAVGGDWTDGGTFTSGGNTVTFNGAGAQALSKAGGETFNSLVIAKSAGTLLLNNAATVNTTFALSSGTLSVGTSTLTLNSTVSGGGTLTSGAAGTVVYGQGSGGQNVLAGNYGNLLFSDFAKTLASAGTIGIAGSFTPGSASGHTTSGSTIDFNGGSQTVPAFAYFHLTMSGSGTKSATGAIDVAGNLTNNAGVLFSGAARASLHGTTHSNAGSFSADTLDVGGGAVLTNSGTMTLSALLSGAGAVTQAPSAVLNIGGTVTIGTLDASATGNTVNYTGAGQAVAPVVYHHLTLSGSGSPVLTGVSDIHGNFTLGGSVTLTASAALSVGGNWTLGTGTSFSAGPFSHVVKGNWVNNGTFDPGTGSMTMGGSSAQTVAGPAFNRLVINNPAGAAMSGNIAVADTLVLQNGTFSIGAHALRLSGALSATGGTLAGGSSADLLVTGSGPSLAIPGLTLNNLTKDRASTDSLLGDVTVLGTLATTNGTLRTGTHSVVLGSAAVLSEAPGKPVVGNVTTTRNVAGTSGTITFGNIGVEITLHGVPLGTTTIVRRTGVASVGNGHASIQRSFDIAPATNAGLNAGFVFRYDPSELSGENAAALELYRSQDNGATWANLGGAADTAGRSVSAAGINEFSRWTLADTANRIGNTPVPATSNIAPTSKIVGAPGFVLVVNGSNFVEGKSTVRFNGANTPTTFVSGSQLTASIPAGDLLAVAAIPVTVFNAGGGGESNAQTFNILPLPPTMIRVESAADGTGTLVPAQSITSGSSITVFAIARDSLNNFVANVAAGSWTLAAVSGGVVAGDLVPAPDAKSALFTAHATGSASIQATAGLLAAVPSGSITVTHGTPARVRVETATDGTGSVVPAQSVASGSHLTVYAITRDASNNFVANDSAAWSLVNVAGGIVAGDLVPAPGAKSAVFTGHVLGSANISAASGALASTSSGTITVVLGTITVGVPLASGWNLVSNPVVNPVPGDSVQQLYPGSLNPYAFFFNAGYIESFTLVKGKGYWAKVGDAATGSILGSTLFTDTVAVTAGWNLVGSISSPLPVAAITSIPAGIVTNNFFGYASGYVVADTLMPGQGYWVKVAQSGSLVFSAYPASLASNRIKIVPSAEAPPPPPEERASNSVAVPLTHVLKQNYPNPFNPSTTITFGLPSRSRVRLEVYNAIGQRVALLLDGDAEAGFHEVTWNAGEIASGLYFYRLEAVDADAPGQSFVQMKKMLLVR